MHGRNIKMTRYGWFLNIKSKYEESIAFISIANIIICLGM